MEIESKLGNGKIALVEIPGLGKSFIKIDLEMRPGTIILKTGDEVNGVEVDITSRQPQPEGTIVRLILSEPINGVLHSQ